VDPVEGIVDPVEGMVAAVAVAVADEYKFWRI
jgi:hypothetical protein